MELGATFIVYGVTFWESHPWYYVYEEPADTYPIPRPHHYFEIIDNKFHPSWQLTNEVYEHGGASCEILPQAWAEDALFYENLVDDDPQAIELMKTIKISFEDELARKGSI